MSLALGASVASCLESGRVRLGGCGAVVSCGAYDTQGNHGAGALPLFIASCLTAWCMELRTHAMCCIHRLDPLHDLQGGWTRHK